MQQSLDQMAFRPLKKLCPLRVAWRQSCRELQFEHRQIRQSQAGGGPSYRHLERLDPGLELLDRGALSVLELLEGRLRAKAPRVLDPQVA